MTTYYIGMDVHCSNTELAIDRAGKIIGRYSVPTTIPAITEVLQSLSGKEHLAMEEGPMAGWQAFPVTAKQYRNFFNRRTRHCWRPNAAARTESISSANPKAISPT